MAASWIQLVALWLGSAVLIVGSRAMTARFASPAVREAAFILKLAGWLAALLGWALVLQTVTGETVGLAIWIDSLVLAARVWERRVAILRHELLWILSAAAESGLPLTEAATAWAAEQRGVIARRGREFAARLAADSSLRQALKPDRELLSDPARVAVCLGEAGGNLPQMLRAVAQWEATHGVAREGARTRLMHGGLLLATLSVALVSLAATYGLPLVHLAEDAPNRLPAVLASLVSAAEVVAVQSAEHPLGLLAFVGLAYLPWLLLARSWGWFGGATSRPAWRVSQIPVSLLMHLLGLARGQDQTAQQIATALTGACDDGAWGRRSQELLVATANGRPLWLALADVWILRPAVADEMQAAEHLGAVVERSRQLSRALAHLEQLRLRRVSALLSLGCLAVLVATVLLAHLTIWLPLLKLSLPS